MFPINSAHALNRYGQLIKFRGSDKIVHSVMADGKLIQDRLRDRELVWSSDQCDVDILRRKKGVDQLCKMRRRPLTHFIS